MVNTSVRLGRVIDDEEMVVMVELVRLWAPIASGRYANNDDDAVAVAVVVVEDGVVDDGMLSS